MTHGGVATLCRRTLSGPRMNANVIVRDHPNAIREHRGHQKHDTLLQAKRSKGKEKATLAVDQAL